jgi:cytochrome c553
MRIITKIAILTSFTTFGFCEMTICFKKNHQDFSTLESVNLDGGKCLGSNSQNDMLQKGWNLDSFSTKNGDYLYVFNQSENSVKNTSLKSIEEIVDKKIEKNEKRKIKEVQKIVKDKKIESLNYGKKLYVNKCSTCHGTIGNIKVGNSASLQTLSLEDIQSAMKGYKLGSYNLGTASEMRPYSIGYTKSDIKNIFDYLKSMNK